MYLHSGQKNKQQYKQQLKDCNIKLMAVASWSWNKNMHADCRVNKYTVTKRDMCNGKFVLNGFLCGNRKCSLRFSKIKYLYNIIKHGKLWHLAKIMVFVVIA